MFGLFKELWFYAKWYIVGAGVCLLAWITHIVWCIQNREFLFMIAGALIGPIGVIHGFCLWFGITWI